MKRQYNKREKTKPIATNEEDTIDEHKEKKSTKSHPSRKLTHLSSFFKPIQKNDYGDEDDDDI